MRRLGWIALALVLAALLPAPAAAADGTLVADPAHGPAAQAVTFTFQSSGWRCRGGTVLLIWESSPIASGRMDDGCTARMTVTPPRGASAGPHQVQAWASSGAASTTYTVDPTVPNGPQSPSPSPSAPAAPPSSPPPPSPSASSPPSATPTPTRPRSTPSPSASAPSAAPTPSVSLSFEAPSAGPCDPADGPGVLAGGEMTGTMFGAPVALHEVDPARIRPTAVDFGGDPQIRLTIDTLPDPNPVNAAVAGDQPVGCLRVDLAGGDGYLWASYAFRDVLLSAYESGTPTSVLSFGYGGVAWRYLRPSGAVVTGDSTAPPTASGAKPIGWLMPGTGMALVAVGGGVWWWLRRTRHVGTRRA